MASDDGAYHPDSQQDAAAQPAQVSRKRRRGSCSHMTATPVDGLSGEAETLASGESSVSAQIRRPSSTSAASGRRQLDSSDILTHLPKVLSAQTNNATCHQDGISQGANNMIVQPLFEKLPEEILHRIHSLMPVRDAACAACLSLAFLQSWRCYSKLILNYHTVGLAHLKFEEREIDLINKVGKILKNHHDNRVKVEALYLDISPCSNIKASYMDKWLRRTVKSGIKELKLVMPLYMKKSYNFPCSVLSDKRAVSSIQSLHLLSCAFHPTSTIGCLKSLKILILSLVHITEEGLENLLSKSSTLEQLRILTCSGIICLKIPCTLKHLKFLCVERCEMLRVVEIDAPNLRSFQYDNALEINVRNCSQLKHVNLSSSYPSGVFFYARVTLPSIARNVESLILVGCGENVNTPMLQSKLPHLKKLEVGLIMGLCTIYDVSSLLSFVDASPGLESFILRVSNGAMAHYPVVGDDDEGPRRKLDFWHNRLRQVTITGFCAARSLVELTVHILEGTQSLERLTLDTTYGYDRRIGNIGKCPTSGKMGWCWQMSKTAVEEAHRAVKTACRYITGRVPLPVQFELLEPCSRCHTGNQ